MTGRTPWAYIAHKDGVWCAVINAYISGAHPRMAAKWQKTVEAEIGRWVVDNWDVKTVYSREGYQTAMDSMRTFDPKIDRKPKVTPCTTCMGSGVVEHDSHWIECLECDGNGTIIAHQSTLAKDSTSARLRVAKARIAELEAQRLPPVCSAHQTFDAECRICNPLGLRPEYLASVDMDAQ